MNYLKRLLYLTFRGNIISEQWQRLVKDATSALKKYENIVCIIVYLDIVEMALLFSIARISILFF